jgi:hypothetical protein
VCPEFRIRRRFHHFDVQVQVVEVRCHLCQLSHYVRRKTRPFWSNKKN